MWSGPPFVINKEPSKRRMVFQLHYTALNETDVARIRESGSRAPGGLFSPAWQAAMELNRHTVPGERICPDFDPVANVYEFSIPLLSEGKHLISADWGASMHSSQTAFIVACITPKKVWIYLEHGGVMTAATHVARLRHQLSIKHRELANEPDWRVGDYFSACGDCSGTGYMLEYQNNHHPISFQSPGVGGTGPGQENWKKREANESLLNALFAVAKRCCYETYSDEFEKCGFCGAPLTAEVGLVIHPQCQKLISQIPTQVITEDGRRSDNLHDYFDAAIYLARWRQRLRGQRAAEIKPTVAWWLQRGTGSDGTSVVDAELDMDERRDIMNGEDYCSYGNDRWM